MSFFLWSNVIFKNFLYKYMLQSSGSPPYPVPPFPYLCRSCKFPCSLHKTLYSYVQLRSQTERQNVNICDWLNCLIWLFPVLTSDVTLFLMAEKNFPFCICTHFLYYIHQSVDTMLVLWHSYCEQCCSEGRCARISVMCWLEGLLFWVHGLEY